MRSLTRARTTLAVSIILFLISLVFARNIFHAGLQEEYSQSEVLRESALKNRDFEEAILLSTKMVEIADRYVFDSRKKDYASYLLASDYIKGGLYSSGLSILTRLKNEKSLDGSDTGMFDLWIGKALAGQGNCIEATEVLRKAKSKMQGDGFEQGWINAVEGLIQCGIKNNEFDQVQKELIDLEKVPDGKNRVTGWRSYSLLKQGRYAEALDLLLLEDRSSTGGIRERKETRDNNIAQLYALNGNYEAAINYYSRNLNGSPRAAGKALAGLARISSKQEKYSQSLVYQKQAIEELRRFDPIGAAAGEADLLYIEEMVGVSRGLYDSLEAYSRALLGILASHHKATEYVENISLSPETYPLALVADLLDEYQARPAAILLLKMQVNRELDEHLVRADSDSDILSKDSRLLNEHRKLIRMLAEEGRYAESANYADLLRIREASNFADVKNTHSAGEYVPAEESWRNCLASIFDKAAFLYEYANQTRNQEFSRLADVLEQYFRDLSKNSFSSDFVGFCDSADAAVAAESDQSAQRQSLRQGEIHLQLTQHEDSISVVVSTRLFSDHVSIPVTLVESEKISEQIRISLESAEVHSLEAFQKAYEKLILPISGLIEASSAKSIIFSLDPRLQAIPFASLHDGENFLVEKYAVRRDSPVSKITSPQVQVRPSFSLFAASGGGGGLAELPGVYREVNEIASTLGSGVNMYLDSDYNWKSFRNEMLSRPTVVHIASHFVFISNKPSMSYLQLGDGREISIREIEESDIRFDAVGLMVLSACQTAVEDKQSNRAQSLSTLLQMRGASSVIATLKKVDDQSSSLFMSHFYKKLREKKNISEAFSEAQRELIQLKTEPNQLDWAAYVLTGDSGDIAI